MCPSPRTVIPAGMLSTQIAMHTPSPHRFMLMNSVHQSAGRTLKSNAFVQFVVLAPICERDAEHDELCVLGRPCVIAVNGGKGWYRIRTCRARGALSGRLRATRGRVGTSTSDSDGLVPKNAGLQLPDASGWARTDGLTASSSGEPLIPVPTHGLVDSSCCCRPSQVWTWFHRSSRPGSHAAAMGARLMVEASFQLRAVQ